MSTTRKPGRPIDLDLQERRRAEILDSAAKLFAAKGYAHADTQDLADGLELSKGTIFRYFPTKRELFAASVERALEKLGQRVDAAADAAADPLEKLLAAMSAYLRYFDEHPEVVELLILERAEFKDRKSSYFDRCDKTDETDERWNGVLTALMADGRFRELPFDRVRNVVGDLLYGTIFSNHMSGRTRTLEEQAGALFDIVFRGLLTDEHRHITTITGPSSHDAPSLRRRTAEPRIGKD